MVYEEVRVGERAKLVEGGSKRERERGRKRSVGHSHSRKRRLNRVEATSSGR